MRDLVLYGAVTLLLIAFFAIPLFAAISNRRTWIRNWLIALPYMALVPIGLAIQALGIDVRIFTEGVTVESFVSAIGTVIIWFAIPIGVAALLERRWQ